MIQYPVQLIFQKRLYWSDLIWRTRFLSSTFFILHSSEGLLDIRGNYQDVSISKNLLRCSETNSCIQFPSRRSDGYQYNNWHLDPATRVNTLKPDCLNPAPESTQASVESSQRWPVMDIMYRDTNSAITLNIRNFYLHQPIFMWIFKIHPADNDVFTICFSDHPDFHYRSLDWIVTLPMTHDL